MLCKNKHMWIKAVQTIFLLLQIFHKTIILWLLWSHINNASMWNEKKLLLSNGNCFAFIQFNKLNNEMPFQNGLFSVGEFRIPQGLKSVKIWSDFSCGKITSANWPFSYILCTAQNEAYQHNHLFCEQWKTSADFFLLQNCTVWHFLYNDWQKKSLMNNWIIVIVRTNNFSIISRSIRCDETCYDAMMRHIWTRIRQWFISIRIPGVGGLNDSIHCLKQFNTSRTTTKDAKELNEQYNRWI